MRENVHLAPLVFVLLATWGISNVLAHTKAGSFVRGVASRVHPLALAFVVCPACTGFWIGAGLAWAGFGAVGPHDAALAVIAGFAASGFNAWINPGDD